MSCLIYIQTSTDEQQQQSLNALAEKSGCTFIADPSFAEDDSLIISFMDAAMSVCRKGSKEKPVFVDFVGGKSGHRRKFGGGKGQDIAKAVGLNKRAKPSVVDATGGLGRDGFILASLGCTVTLIERSPVIAALLEDGLKRARQNIDVAEIAGRMTLINGDSKEVMETLAQEGQRADIVYLDPMFPHREKSALVKKEMRLFQDLLGHDPDSDQLLAPALKLAEYRIAIKRPKGAPDLNQQEPTYRLEGKACRYDIYALKAI